MDKHIEELPPVVPNETLAGRPGLVDLWCFYYEAKGEPEILSAYLPLLTPEERARHGRFYFERDRRQFLATRALVRTVLSRYAHVPPAAWRFATGDHGKPHIDSPKVTPPLYFNLTNTPGLVVCAVSVAHDTIGVDAEYVLRKGETVGIAQHYFAPCEVAALRSLPETHQRDRFFAYWTLKESYIKARGQGLAIPLEQFAFMLDGRQEIGVEFDPLLRDDPLRWRFELFRTSTHHLVAVGVDCGGGTLSLRASRFIPLKGVVPFANTIWEGEP